MAILMGVNLHVLKKCPSAKVWVQSALFAFHLKVEISYCSASSIVASLQNTNQHLLEAMWWGDD